MFDEQSQQITTVPVAIVFLAIAAILGVWVLTTVNATINDTKSPAILHKLAPDESYPVDINTPSGKIELPKQAFNMMAHFMLYLFLLIPTAIAIALIKGSVALLKPDFTKQMRHLFESVRKSHP